jgi:cell wall-associated NlpC family hydrolase
MAMADPVSVDTSLLGNQGDTSGDARLAPTVALGTDTPDPFADMRLPDMSPTDFNGIMNSSDSPLTFSGNATMNAGSKRQEALNFAKQFLGVDYKWGGTSPAGFDCSGLVQYVWKKFGVQLPRVSQAQAGAGQTTRNLNELKPMDLVMMDNTPNGPGHVAFWLGNGEILEAPHTGAQVRIRKLGKNEAMYGVKLAIPG